jgi:hypothetical protein
VLIAVALARPALAAPPDPVADGRLTAVRAPLRAVLDGADRDGLPRDLLQSKVREGLAKGVPPARILAVVRSMRDDLGRERARVRTRLGLKHPPAALLRALLEAQQAGVAAPATDALFAALGKRAKEPGLVAHAVEVLTDLTLAGYPVDRARRVVSLVATRDPGALGRVRADLERLRRAESLTPAEAVDAVARGLERGESIDKALKSAQSDQAHGRGGERGRGAPAAPGKKSR